MKQQLLPILLLLCQYAAAQSEYELRYFAEPYTDTFKQESVVVARMMEEYRFEALGLNDYKVHVVFRAQYILKDASAINSFSTLSKNKNLKRYELKQLKPDGKSSVIYAYLDKNYPDDGYDRSEEEQKDLDKENEEIPLEDLSIGDIIDYKYEYTYTTRNKDPRKITLENGKFDQVSAQVKNSFPYRYLMYKSKFFSDKYPIASAVVVLHMPDELSLSFKTLNADYSFTTVSAGGQTTRECRSSLIPAFVPEEFSYYYLSRPVLKFAVVQNNPAKAAVYPYQFEQGKDVRQQAAALIKRLYTDKQYLADYLYYLDTRKSNAAYTQVSLDQFFSRFVKTFRQKSKLEQLNTLHEYLCNNDHLNPKHFGDMAYAVILARFCDKTGIPYKLMGALHRYDGRWKDIISPYEISWGIYIPQSSADLFVCSYEEESNIYRRYGSLSGTELLLANPKLPGTAYTTMQYPVQKAENNTYIQNTEFRLHNGSDSWYNAAAEYKIAGEQKYAMSSYIASRFEHDRLRTDAAFYGLIRYNEVYDFSKFDKQEDWVKEYERFSQSYTNYYQDYYKSRMQAFLYDEYHLKTIELDSHRIDGDGSIPDNESTGFGFKTWFRIQGLTEKGRSDSFLLMHLGQLITEQFKLPAFRVQQRQGDVYVSNLKDIRWNNRIEIPAGFSCVNLDEFNCSLENRAGLFSCTASVKDGFIDFSIAKVYKAEMLPASGWPDMVAFLHTAESMFRKKLLLKKIR